MAEERLGALFYDLELKKKGFDRAVRNAIKELEKLGLIEKDLAKTGKQMGDGQKKAADGTDKLGKSAKGAQSPFKKLLARMRQFLVIVGTFIVIRRAVRFLIEFEKAMAEVSTISGESESKVKRLRDGVLDLAKSLPQTPADLAAGAYQAISSGVTDAADALLVLKASATAAVAGLSDTRSAVDAITTVLNAFQMGADRAAHVADVLFKTVELGKVTFPELSQNIGNVATSAALAGVTIEETTAAIATLTKFGINAAEATTSLNRLFLTLTSQSDDQTNAFRRLGVEFNTTTVRQKGFLGLIEELNKLTDEQIDRLAELFPNIRAARAAFVLAGKGTAEYARILAQTYDASGAAQAAAEKMNATFGNQAKLFANNVNVVLQNFAENILPTVAKGLEKVNRLFLSDIDLRIEAYERLGATELALGVQREELLRTSQEQLDEILDRSAKFVDILTGARGGLEFLSELGVGVPQAAVSPTAGIRLTRDQLDQIDEIRSALSEIRHIYESTGTIQGTIVELENRAAEATGLRLRLFGALAERLAEAQKDERERVRLQELIKDLTETEYNMRQRQLRWFQQQLEMARRMKDEERARNLEMKIGLINIQNQIREMEKLIQVQRLAVPEEYRLLPMGNILEVETSIGRLQYALADLDAQRQELLTSGDALDEEEQRRIKLIESQWQELDTLLKMYQSLAEILGQYGQVLSGNNEVLNQQNVLTDDQIKAIRSLNKALAGAGPETAAKKSLLQEMKFEDSVRAIAEAFKIQLPEDIETGAKRMGVNWRKHFGEAIKKIPDDVLALMDQLRVIEVEQFDPGEALGKRLEEGIAKLEAKELLPGDEVIAEALKIERAMFEFFEGKIPEHYQVSIEKYKELLRTIAVEDFEKELAKKLSQLTQTASEQALAAFDVWIEETERKLGAVPDELKDEVAQIRELLVSAVGVEEIENELDKLEDELERRLAGIEAGPGTVEEKAAARAAVYEDIVQRAEALQFIVGEMVSNEEERERLEAAIAGWIAQQRANMDDAVSVAREQVRLANRRLRNMQATVGLINQAVEGMVSFLKATGIVGEDFEKMIDSLRQIGIGIASLQAGLEALSAIKDAADDLERAGDAAQDIVDYGMALGSIAAGGIGILGGIGTLVGGLLGGGVDPEEEARQRIMKKNTEALLELKRGINQLRGTFDISGDLFSRSLAALKDIRFGELGQTGWPTEGLTAHLAEFGLTMKDLQKVADQFGITLTDAAGMMIPDEVKRLAEALRTASDALIGFPGTLEGITREAQFTTDIFDLEDPQLQLAALIAGLVGAGDDFTRWLLDMEAQGRDATEALGEWQAGLQAMLATFGDDILKIPALADLFTLDLTTAEGRAQAEQLIKELFRQFQLGQLDIAALGFTAPQEFLDFIAGIENLLDQIDETADTLGETQDVRRQVSITELQANQLLAYQSTMATIQARIERILTDIYNYMLVNQGVAPPVGAPYMNPITGQTQEINVDISIGTVEVGQGSSIEQAQVFLDDMMDELRRRLGEEFKAARQRQGELN